MLNTLKDLKEVNGVEVMTNDERPLLENGEVDWNAFDEMRKRFPICIDHKTDMVSFKLMTEPLEEGGTGCQHVEMIAVAKHIIQYFHNAETEKLDKLKRSLLLPMDSEKQSEGVREEISNLQSSFNANRDTLLALSSALHCQLIRTSDRNRRGVEGTSKA